jgi:hypothetical protein
MAARWGQGLTQLDEALARTPACKRPDAERMRGLAAFMLAGVETTIHVKQWWQLRQRLFGEAGRAVARALLDEMTALAEREIANAAAMIPVVAADSRLGWEPTMDYVCSPDHLRWKIVQVRHVIDHEIPAYRAALDV